MTNPLFDASFLKKLDRLTLLARQLFSSGEIPHDRRLRPTLTALYNDLFPA